MNKNIKTIAIFFAIPFLIMGFSVEYALCYELFSLITLFLINICD